MLKCGEELWRLPSVVLLGPVLAERVAGEAERAALVGGILVIAGRLDKGASLHTSAAERVVAGVARGEGGLAGLLA